MIIRIKRPISLLFACAGSLILLVVLLTVAGQTGSTLHAAPPNDVRSEPSTARSLQFDPVTPVVTITFPGRGAVLTQTTQVVSIEYSCNSLTCVGNPGIEEISVTVSGQAGPYHEASFATIKGLSTGIYTYTWLLPNEDMAAHVLIARARNGWDNVGPSKPVNVFVDKVPPYKHATFLPFVVQGYPAPWIQGAGSQDKRFRTPSACEDQTWYAGTRGNDGVWKSTDDAQTWTKTSNLQPDALPVVTNQSDCSELFAAVWGSGVFRLGGTTPEPINTGLGQLLVYGLALTGNNLYAGTESEGVYKTDKNSVNWTPVNEGISDLRIRSLFAAGPTLYAGGKDCRLYISTNEASSWTEHRVLTRGCDQAQVWSIAEAKTTLYAGMGAGKGLYAWDGAAWNQITLLPAGTIHGLAYSAPGNYLFVSVFGKGVYRCSVDDDGMVAGCSGYSSGLTTQGTRELQIHDDTIVAGSDDGAWYRPLQP